MKGLVLLLLVLLACARAQLVWKSIGNGVVVAHTGGAPGGGVAVLFGGYQVTLDEAKGWAQGLWDAQLHSMHVSYVVAVQGPDQVYYFNRELATTALAKLLVQLVPGVSPSAPVLVAAHSSGAYPAHELMHLLFDNAALDPHGVTRGRIVYYDLDGGIGCNDGPTAGWWICINATVAEGLRQVVASYGKGPNGLWGPNTNSMRRLAAMFPNAVGFELDGTNSGCVGVWCVHMVQIVVFPANKTAGSPTEYAGPFNAKNPVQTGYFQ